MLFSLLVLKRGILIHKTGSYLQINNHWQFARYLDTIHTIYDLDSFFFFWKKRRGEYPLCMDYENDMKSNILLFVNVQALMCLILDGFFVEFFEYQFIFWPLHCNFWSHQYCRCQSFCIHYFLSVVLLIFIYFCCCFANSCMWCGCVAYFFIYLKEVLQVSVIKWNIYLNFLCILNY